MSVLVNIWWSCLAVIFVLFIKWSFKFYQRWKLVSLIPGPKGLPILGNSLDFHVEQEEILLHFVRLWHEFKEEKQFKIRLLTDYYLILRDPILVESLLSSNQNNEKGDSYIFLRPWLGDGLLVSSGDKWRSRRKLLTPAFHFRILEDFIEIFNQQSRILVNKLRNETKKSVEILHQVSLCALDVICETAMGQSMNAQTNDSEYVQAVCGISEIIMRRMFQPMFWFKFMFALSPDGRKHNKYLKILHDFTIKVIREKKAERKNKSPKKVDEQTEILGIKKRKAFLDLLLDYSEAGNHLTEEDLREEVDTFMFEGHDTTAASIAWTLYLLGHNPHVQKKVHEELDLIIGDEKRDVTSEDIKSLKYLECVIKESLRLYPSVPTVTRFLTKNIVLDGRTIPSGTNIVLLIYMFNRSPKVFPNPEVFDPDRFLLNNLLDRQHFTYIPFSAGARNCIGQKFALMEEKVILSHVLRSFQVESIEPRENMKLMMNLILKPKNGIHIRLIPRRNV